MFSTIRVVFFFCGDKQTTYLHSMKCNQEFLTFQGAKKKKKKNATLNTHKIKTLKYVKSI